MWIIGEDITRKVLAAHRTAIAMVREGAQAGAVAEELAKRYGLDREAAFFVVGDVMDRGLGRAVRS